MGNEQAKKNSSAKAQVKKPVVSSGKSLDNMKNVLLLYKASMENSNAGDHVDYFSDALNQVKPPGCVVVESENALNVFELDEESIRNRTERWLNTPNSVIIIVCSDKDGPSREHFTDDTGALTSRIFPVCFGTEVPSAWPETHCLGLANPEKINRPNDFEGNGLETLVAAILGVE